MPTHQKEPHVQKLLLEERNRIAEELHSGAAQSLSNALFLINLFEKSGKKEELEEARQSVQFAIHDIRYAIRELREEEPWPLLPSIRDSINKVKEKRKIPVEFVVEGNEVPISSEIGYYLLTLIEEGLYNIAKHANATTSRLTLTFKPKEVEVIIEDNGSGFDPSIASEGNFHFGLKFLKERVSKLGGRLKLDSVPGKGTKLHVVIPIN